MSSCRFLLKHPVFRHMKDFYKPRFFPKFPLTHFLEWLMTEFMQTKFPPGKSLVLASLVGLAVITLQTASAKEHPHAFLTNGFGLFTNAPSFPTNLPVGWTNLPKIPTNLPVWPTNLPAFPTNLPAWPTNLPKIPTNLPTFPTNLPAWPTNLPAWPTNLPKIPTNLPAFPTNLPAWPAIPTNPPSWDTNATNIEDLIDSLLIPTIGD